MKPVGRVNETVERTSDQTIARTLDVVANQTREAGGQRHVRCCVEAALRTVRGVLQAKICYRAALAKPHSVARQTQGSATGRKPAARRRQSRPTGAIPWPERAPGATMRAATQERRIGPDHRSLAGERPRAGAPGPSVQNLPAPIRRCTACSISTATANSAAAPTRRSPASRPGITAARAASSSSAPSSTIGAARCFADTSTMTTTPRWTRRPNISAPGPTPPPSLASCNNKGCALSFLRPGGLFLVSTLTLDEAAARACDHWYIAPRNGHISIHSRASLQQLFASLGRDLHHFSDALHLAHPRRPAPPVAP